MLHVCLLTYLMRNSCLTVREVYSKPPLVTFAGPDSKRKFMRLCLKKEVPNQNFPDCRLQWTCEQREQACIRAVAQSRTSERKIAPADIYFSSNQGARLHSSALTRASFLSKSERKSIKGPVQVNQGSPLVSASTVVPHRILRSSQATS